MAARAKGLGESREIGCAPISPAFTGDHAWCSERMMACDRLDAGTALPAFFSEGGFDAAIDRYKRASGGTDRRAVVSMWSLYYFSGIAIPYLVAVGLAGQRLPIEFPAMTIALDDDGLPRAFGLPHAGSTAETSTEDAFDTVDPLVDGHLETVVNRFAANGIAARLCWNNAAVYIDYALRLTGMQPEAGTSDLPIFLREHRGNGRPNPFKGSLRYIEDEDGCSARRKLCCLRYLLPGVASCGRLCALPAQRKCS